MIIKPVRLTDAPFVAIPNFLNIDKQPIKYLDTLVYAALRSFNNDEDDCFPMHDTIGKRAGMSKRFVIDSVKRLEQAGYITVVRSQKIKVSNQYYFKPLERFDQIPCDLFTKDGLTANEKAILICLRQFFVHGPLQCVDSITTFSKCLGLSYNVISPLYKSLVDKGYITERMKVYKNNERSYVVKSLTDKILWHKMACIRPFYEKLNPMPVVKLKVA